MLSGEINYYWHLNVTNAVAVMCSSFNRFLKFLQLLYVFERYILKYSYN